MIKMANSTASVTFGFLFAVLLLISTQVSAQLTRNSRSTQEKGSSVAAKDMDIIFHWDRNEPVNGRIYTGRKGNIYGRFDYVDRRTAATRGRNVNGRTAATYGRNENGRGVSTYGRGNYGRGSYNPPGSNTYTHRGYGSNSVYGRRGNAYIPRN